MRRIVKKIKKKFHHLFVPHRSNNHRSKLLHHDSLQKIIVLLMIVQFSLSFTLRVKPGILGFASNIAVSDIVALTNQERAKAGFDALTFNSVLSQSAVAKANHMFANDYWAHNAPDGTTPWYFFRSVDYAYLYAGENLARDFGDSNSVLVAWMNSPTHRENILSGRYDEIGIGVVNGVLNGQETTLVVQHFGKQATPQVAADVDNNSTTAFEPEPIPEIALQEKVDEIVETIPVPPIQEQIIVADTSLQATPRVPMSSFQVTKIFNIIIAVILIITLFIDGCVIYRDCTQRRTGKNLIHISLFIVITIIILLTSSGRIL